MKNGISRVFMLLSVCWVLGMGFYQYQQSHQVSEKSMTIELNKDTQIRIDASGISQEKTSDIRMRQLMLVFLPALLLLVVVPVYGWLASGFKSEGK